MKQEVKIVNQNRSNRPYFPAIYFNFHQLTRLDQ